MGHVERVSNVQNKIAKPEIPWIPHIIALPFKGICHFGLYPPGMNLDQEGSTGGAVVVLF